MKKRIKLLLVLLYLFTLKEVYAKSIDVSVECPSSAFVNEQIICNIYSNSVKTSLTGIKANYEIVNGAYYSFTVGNEWVKYHSTNNGFVIGNTNGGIPRRSLLGSLAVNPSVGVGKSVSIKLTNINASDEKYNDYDISNKEVIINILDKNVNNISSNNVLLDALEVEGYSLEFDKKKFDYELELSEDVKSVNILATSKNNKVFGTGKFYLKNDENIFKVYVKNESIENVYTIIIKRNINVSDNVDNDEVLVSKALEKYDVVNIDLNKETDELIAYQNIVEKVLNTYKSIVYNIYENNKLLYSYIFNGKEMDYILDNINLDISFRSKKAESLINYFDINNLVLNMKYKSYFPKGTILKIYDTKSRNDKDIKLYKVSSKHKLELVESNIKFKDNILALELDKGDLYIVKNVKSINDNSSIKIIVITICIIIVLIISISVTFKYKVLKDKKVRRNQPI